MSDAFVGRFLTSTLEADGTLRLAIGERDFGVPKDNEVMVRVEASPINPSDLGMLLAAADIGSAERDGDTTRLTVSQSVLGAMQGRVGHAMPVGNEGAGTVVAAGSDPAAQALLGRTVAGLGGAMYAQYRRLPVQQVLALNEGTSAADGASCFVNPLTALGMVDTMRLEGHQALVHTAAASNLGQMLVKICLADGVPLVNVVRKPAQVELLKSLGAEHVVDMSADDAQSALTDAIAATGATIGFDATGGGKLADRILSAMEAALMRQGGDFNRYGSSTHKQVYIYGGLERAPTTLNRSYGMAWGVGGWLLTPFMERVGEARMNELRQRVADEIHTTFESSYARQISLDDVLDPEAIAFYGRMSTGEKVLVNPQG